MSFCFSQFSSFGFGGSRRGCPLAASQLPAAAALIQAFHSSPRVLVSSAAGVSASARALFPAAQVFSSGSAGVVGAPGAALYAARGAALIRALAGSPLPLWLCWPGQACPPGQRPSSSPSRAWGGFGSGSWAECSFAAALGVPVLVFLPSGVLPPASWGAWSECWGGWLLRPAPPLSLF